MNRDEKAAVIERLTERIRESAAMIVADYRGLSVTDIAELRNQLRESGAAFHVSKNTLTRRAAEEAGQPALIDLLEGPTAIAFVNEDPAATAKKLQDAARRTRVLALRGAVLDGRTLGADDVRRLAELPPREQILAEALGAVAGPLQSAYGVLSAPLRELLLVLDAYIAKRQAAEAA